jgi:hypothetical protein
MKVDFYKEMSNYISNELKLSRSDIQDMIAKVIESKVKTCIDNLNRRKFIEDRADVYISKHIDKLFVRSGFGSKHKSIIETMVQNAILDTFDIKVSRKSKES